MTERRRDNRDQHALTVHATNGHLEVRCACGRIVRGQRNDDVHTITLNDLLELVRLHHANA